MIAFVFIAQIPNNMAIFYGESVPNLVSGLEGLTSMLMIIIVVAYDNLQAFYLTYLVFWNKKGKSNGKMDRKTMNSFKEMLLTNVIVLIFDWFGVILFIWVTIMSVSTQTLSVTALYIIQICELNTSIHTCINIFVLRALKNFTFADMKMLPRTPIRKEEITKVQTWMVVS
ncbi:hypothetical protein HDV06_004359 [Boothiomyces sp. JEL0866]|nr:hypothetical protein HDV06_004359 [Boothiomyces sp. JEL0866]